MFPKPTKRAVVDVGHKCSIECKMCYWLHELKSGTASWKPVDELKNDINKANRRDNNYIDFTGGEPTLYPYITELIEYINSIGMKSCIITNAITGKNQTQKILEAGIDDWLVSVHDHAMKLKGGKDFNVRERQERFLKQVQDYNIGKDERPYRFNCCMSRENQDDLVNTAAWAVKWKPRIFNFINMNPHNDWQKDIEGTKAIIGDLDMLEYQLRQAIPILLENGVGVNVRYFPMCKLPEVFRMHVCNDRHVCLSGDTKIRLLGGSTQTIKELSSKYKVGDKFYVYSLNDKNELMAGIAYSPRITGRNKKCIKLTFDNGETLTCTPDHLLRLRNGEYVKAENSLGLPLAPFKTKMNHKVISIEDSGVLEQVYDITVNKYHNFALDCGIFVHNCFDPYEWDYDITPKSFQTFLKASDNMSRSVEWNGQPCLKCDLKFICGGINSAFFRAVGDKDIIQAVKVEGIQRDDFYHYRRHNTQCLIDRFPSKNRELYYTIASEENFAFVPLFIRHMMKDCPECDIAILSDHGHHNSIREIVDTGIGYGIYDLINHDCSADVLQFEKGINDIDKIKAYANERFKCDYNLITFCKIEESKILPGDKKIYEMYRKCGMLDQRVEDLHNGAYPDPFRNPVKLNKPKPKKKPALVHYQGNLLIYTLCDKNYEWYIPLFARSMALANPKQPVEINVLGGVDKKVVDLVNNDNIMIYDFDGKSSGKYMTASLRFLIPPKQSISNEFQYYLITDIDMMFMPENSTIIDQHCKHMERDGTGCYENWISQYLGGDPRMPGVHFITHEWFDKTHTVRKTELEKLLKYGANDYYYDEVMLGRVVRDSGLKLPPQVAKLWRHHGIHLGDWRINMDRKGKTIPQNVFQKMHIQTLLNDDKFMALSKTCSEHIPLITKVIKRWPMLFK